MPQSPEQHITEAEKALKEGNPALAHAHALIALTKAGLRDKKILPNGDTLHPDGTISGVRG